MSALANLHVGESGTAKLRGALARGLAVVAGGIAAIAGRIGLSRAYNVAITGATKPSFNP